MESRSSQALIPFSRKSADLLPEDIAILKKDFSHEMITVGILAVLLTGVGYLAENFYLILIPVAMGAYMYFKSHNDISAGTKNVITGNIDSKITQVRRQKRRNIHTYFFMVGGEKWEVTRPDYFLFEEGDIIELHTTITDKVFSIKKLGEQKKKPINKKKLKVPKLFIPYKLGTLVTDFKKTVPTEDYQGTTGNTDAAIVEEPEEVKVLKPASLPPIITDSLMTAEEITAVIRERNQHTAYLAFSIVIFIIFYHSLFPFLSFLTDFIPMGDTLLFAAIGGIIIIRKFLPYQKDIKKGSKQIISTSVEGKGRLGWRKEGITINGMRFSSTRKTHQIIANGEGYIVTPRQYADCHIGQLINVHITPASKIILNIQPHEN
ncbi:MAG: hypothetical protein V4642_04310 [Bacteroidota bacterium]